MALYVYGLMRAADLAAGAQLQADGTPSVKLVVHEDIAAIIGEVADDPVRLRRELVLAHNDVLQGALQRGPVLPLRFGTVVPDEDTLRRELLAPRQAELRARLQGLAGKAEFRLKVTYREEVVLREILAADPKLSRSAARLRGMPAEASHFQRLDLGEGLSVALEARRESDAQRLLSQLTPLVVAAEVGALQAPAMVLNASFLVADEARARFDAAVEQLAGEGAQWMEFKLIGPLPAHSFADGSSGEAAVSASGRSA